MPKASEGAGASNIPGPDVVRITMSPAFKLVFRSVLGITVLSMIVSCPLTVLAGPEPSPDMKALLTTFLTTWKMGFGAIIGLLGGKAL
jgi:hypothetical protein